MASAREDEATAYRDGYRAGYAKGIEDGAGQGYSDAKARAWIAVDLIDEPGASYMKKKMSEALKAMVGARA